MGPDICETLAVLCGQPEGERKHHETTDALHNAHAEIAALRLRANEAEIKAQQLQGMVDQLTKKVDERKSGWLR